MLFTYHIYLEDFQEVVIKYDKVILYNLVLLFSSSGTDEIIK